MQNICQPRTRPLTTFVPLKMRATGARYLCQSTFPKCPLTPACFSSGCQETEGLCVFRTFLPGVPTPSSYAGCSLHLWHDIHKLISPSRPLLGLVFTEYSMTTFPCVSHSVMSNSFRLPPGLQHSRLPCPSPTPGACSDSCPESW